MESGQTHPAQCEFILLNRLIVCIGDRIDLTGWLVVVDAIDLLGLVDWVGVIDCIY